MHPCAEEHAMRYYNSKAVIKSVEEYKRQQPEYQEGGVVKTSGDTDNKTELYLRMSSVLLDKTGGPKVKVAKSIPTDPHSLLLKSMNQGIHWQWINEKMNSMPPILNLTATHKAKGQDKVPTEVWKMDKEAAPVMAAVQHRLMNAYNPYPKLHVNRVLPMTKTGSTHIETFKQFRPISIFDSDKKIFDAADTTLGSMVMDAFASDD
jgi:hypothetical protein